MIEKMVKVLIVATGVETSVSQKYYDRYKDEGIELIKEAPIKPAPRKTRAKKVPKGD